MTLKNCINLLKHYEDLQTAEAPVGHVNWGLVQAQAKINAEAMALRVKSKSRRYLKEDRITREEHEINVPEDVVVEPEAEVVEEEVDLNSKTKDELKAMLDEAGTEYSDTATKAELIALLGA